MAPSANSDTVPMKNLPKPITDKHLELLNRLTVINLNYVTLITDEGLRIMEQINTYGHLANHHDCTERAHSPN